MDASRTIAAAALAVAVASAVYARRAWLASNRQARAAEVQARLATQQEAERNAAKRRAVLRAGLRRDADRGALVLYTDGEAPALDVRVSVAADTAEAQEVASVVFGRVQPVQHLAPGTSHELPLLTVDGIPDRYRVDVRWTNPDGTAGNWRSDLSLV